MGPEPHVNAASCLEYPMHGHLHVLCGLSVGVALSHENAWAGASSLTFQSGYMVVPSALREQVVEAPGPH